MEKNKKLFYIEDREMRQQRQQQQFDPRKLALTINRIGSGAPKKSILSKTPAFDWSKVADDLPQQQQQQQFGPRKLALTRSDSGVKTPAFDWSKVADDLPQQQDQKSPLERWLKSHRQNHSPPPLQTQLRIPKTPRIHKRTLSSSVPFPFVPLLGDKTRPELPLLSEEMAKVLLLYGKKSIDRYLLKLLHELERLKMEEEQARSRQKLNVMDSIQIRSKAAADRKLRQLKILQDLKYLEQQLTKLKGKLQKDPFDL